MLMNLGVLVTLAQHNIPLYLIIIDNGLYEVTGGQGFAGAGRTDFAMIAQGAGIARAHSFKTLESWQVGGRRSAQRSGSGGRFAGGAKGDWAKKHLNRRGRWRSKLLACARVYSFPIEAFDEPEVTMSFVKGF